jgi:hypothetical protein
MYIYRYMGVLALMASIGGTLNTIMMLIVSIVFIVFVIGILMGGCPYLKCLLIRTERQSR